MIHTKYLFIVRHGHAGFEANSDKQRKLTNQGQIAVGSTAEFINQKCEDHRLSIDHCISSDANRTMQTSEILCEKLNIQTIDACPELYSTLASTWMDKIISCTAINIVLVGHNPTLSQLVNQLSGNQCYMNPANCAFIKLQIKDGELVLPATLLGYLKGASY
jgi:phosphohistidine phosphatase